MEGQWESWTVPLRETRSPFLAYLQAFSNTYCSPGQLKDVLERIAILPDSVGVAIGTRPDCLDSEKLDILAALDVQELWLDLGLQSSDNAILKQANRGHSAEDFARTVEQAAGRGIKVCAHLIAGLPGDDDDGFAASVDFVSALPIAGIKFHNLYICNGTPLEAEFLHGNYKPMGFEDYLCLLTRVLPRLRPDVVVHRMASDPAYGELVAPEWALRKQEILNRLTKAMLEADIWQGKTAGAESGIPAWYSAKAPLPPSLT
ncbi:radical SAM protein, TIGR01212 family [Desulfovibrio ferrophilus]|uniref:Radical SAM protein, TIGR01212 family n=2 Tax=Desulfovibrio ferrophilus TaxID=241368 RepID=A0A2Z6B2L3_9BACT|nr:radical SAM protein, TIGR01212 family [Desulfovibrio ferrophilus]